MKYRKIAVVGSRAVGKSSLIIHFVEGHFVESYFPTIENTHSKQFEIGGDQYQLEILDTAGQDEWGILSSSHTLGIHAYLIVYSIASKSSFETAKILHDKILNYTGNSSVPCVLVGNKSDLDSQRQVSVEDGMRMASGLKCKYIETSAKLNRNVKEAFIDAINEIKRTEAGGVDASKDGKGDRCTVM